MPVSRNSPDRQLVLQARVALLLEDEGQIPSRNLVGRSRRLRINRRGSGRGLINAAQYLRALHRGRFRYGLSVRLKDAARLLNRDAVTADENSKGHRAVDRLRGEGTLADAAADCYFDR